MSPTPVEDLLAEPVFATAGPAAAFVPAVQTCLEVLIRRFPRYREFIEYRTKGVLTRPITTLEQVNALPALFLPILKGYQFPLPDDLSVAFRLTSSGTTGAPSVIPLDGPSMERRVAALMASYRGVGLFRGRVRAIAFLLDPASRRMAGSVVIDAVLRRAPEVVSVQYLARLGSSGMQFQPSEAAAAVVEAARQGPVLLVGYPALMAAAVRGLLAAGTPRLPLPDGSLVLTGGGWKAFLPGVTLEQEAFRRQLMDFFEVPADGIRDMFGLSECPAVFVQCGRGCYHTPAFAWAQAIDPESGAEVPADEVGLLQLTVPLTTSYPLLKILTTDKVTLHLGCPCGLAAPFLVPRGRVSAARFETCAMKVGRGVA